MDERKQVNPQMDILLGFYNTLAQMNALDKRIFKLYSGDVPVDRTDDAMKIMLDYGIDYSQYRMIQLKLVRLGLLESENALRQSTNVDLIIDYLKAVHQNKLNDAKRFLDKMKKSSKQDHYSITSYGRSFLKFLKEHP